MKSNLTVILCTHNPRRDYLKMALNALNNQTLSKKLWEFLVIDNASDRILAEEIDLSWHPYARHIRENILGLTPARLRGIAEAKADLLVFVDDDNVLNFNYLESVLEISQTFPIIGAWGGQIQLEFEVTPSNWMKPFFPMLGDRAFNQDRWSNFRYHNDTTPCGAGLCVRREVAQAYVKLVKENINRIQMDRRGGLLISGGDSDLALTACDLGMFTGQFAVLELTHLIAAHRTEEAYLLKLAEGMGYSHRILSSLREVFPPESSWKRRFRLFVQRSLMHPKARQVSAAFQNGELLALQKLTSDRTPPSSTN